VASERIVSRELTIAPNQLVKAAVEGRLPRGINIERLRDPHAEWGRQFEKLGLDPG
jgi:site-specific DNA recombinase